VALSDNREAEAATMTDRVTVSSFEDVKEAFRQKALQQALYDEGADLMQSVIVSLHGDDHRVRRRVENRLFRRETFRLYEHELIPQAIDDLLAPHLETGWVELLALTRRAMLHVGLLVSGVDRTAGTEGEAQRVAALLVRLNRASNVAQSPLPKQDVIADGQAALRELERDFLAPSADRRRELLARVERDELAEADLPKDVLTTLLRYQDELGLSWDLIVKEVAYFPWVASHSTANALAHTVDELFTWLAEHPADRDRATHDALFLQQCVHETLRLHPASPEAWRHCLDDLTLRSGTSLPKGSFVVLDLTAANRDRAVFGADAEAFNPHRKLPNGVAPWGHSFGGGVHACIGQELAGGLAHSEGIDDRDHLFGTIVVMVQTLLRHGAEPDPDRGATPDYASGRPHYESFYVRFDRAAAVR
jgi:cytochrome P450